MGLEVFVIIQRVRDDEGSWDTPWAVVIEKEMINTALEQVRKRIKEAHPNEPLDLGYHTVPVIVSEERAVEMLDRLVDGPEKPPEATESRRIVYVVMINDTPQKVVADPFELDREIVRLNTKLKEEHGDAVGDRVWWIKVPFDNAVVTAPEATESLRAVLTDPKPAERVYEEFCIERRRITRTGKVSPQTAQQIAWEMLTIQEQRLVMSYLIGGLPKEHQPTDDKDDDWVEPN